MGLQVTCEATSVLAYSNQGPPSKSMNVTAHILLDSRDAKAVFRTLTDDVRLGLVIGVLSKPANCLLLT